MSQVAAVVLIQEFGLPERDAWKDGNNFQSDMLKILLVPKLSMELLQDWGSKACQPFIGMVACQPVQHCAAPSHQRSILGSISEGPSLSKET